MSLEEKMIRIVQNEIAMLREIDSEIDYSAQNEKVKTICDALRVIKLVSKAGKICEKCNTGGGQ